MLDEFRDLSDNDDNLFDDETGADSLFDGEEKLDFEDLDDYAEYDGSLDSFDSLGEDESAATARRRSSGSNRLTLGLTARQRFIVSFLVLMTSCLFSMLCLLLTNKIII